jgi:outer membrane protein OmpA-like peptidoglycan-associated protein
MATRRLGAFAAVLMLFALGCAKPKPAPPPAPPPPQPAPPAPKQNIFALLEDPQGKTTAIVVTNTGGTQEIAQPNQAVRVERADVAPTAPYAIDSAAVRRLFGSALDAMPEPEARFVLYFDESRDTLNAQAQATIPAILKAVQDRRSTDIRVTGHTDRTGSTASNLQLGLRRADRVAAVLRGQGVDAISISVTSHGEADPIVKTGPGLAEPLNRRVEVIVH